MALHDHKAGQIVGVVSLLVNEAHVEALSEHRDDSCRMELGKILTEADTLTSAEWHESMGMALFAFRCF